MSGVLPKDQSTCKKDTLIYLISGIPIIAPIEVLPVGHHEVPRHPLNLLLESKNQPDNKECVLLASWPCVKTTRSHLP